MWTAYPILQRVLKPIVFADVACRNGARIVMTRAPFRARTAQPLSAMPM
jgi:hypothetical protein